MCGLCLTTIHRAGGARKPTGKCHISADVLYDKVMADDRLKYFFKGIDMKVQRTHQVCDTSYPFSISFTVSS